MEYRKPQILLVQMAIESIQSNLDKDVMPPDSRNIGTQTGASAYEADE
jgi:hypothetical protein